MSAESRPTVHAGEVWATRSIRRLVVSVEHVRRSRGGHRGLRWMVLVENTAPDAPDTMWRQWLTGAEWRRWVANNQAKLDSSTNHQAAQAEHGENTPPC